MYVYIHDQCMVKTAFPGGVNTLQCLKHPISLHSIHNRCFHYVPLVFLVVYNLQTRFRYYTPTPCKFSKDLCKSFFLKSNLKRLCTALKLWLCVILKRFSTTSVQSNRCRRSLNMNSSALDIVLISYIFNFSRLSVNFISNLKTQKFI